MGVCREATRTIRGNRESRGTIVPPREHQNIDWVAKREAMTAMPTMKSVWASSKARMRGYTYLRRLSQPVKKKARKRV